MTEMIIWLVLLIVAIVAEVLTMGLTTIWFAGGALVAIFAAILNAPVWLQVVLFLVVSLVLLIFTRPVAVKYFIETYIPAMKTREKGQKTKSTELWEKYGSKEDPKPAGQ